MVRNRQGCRWGWPRSTGFLTGLGRSPKTRCYDSRVKRAVSATILLILSHLAAAQGLVRESVEEVVAVVDRTPILASDIDLAALLDLTTPSAVGTAAEYRSTLLDARIRLEVQYRDLEISGVIYRLDLDVAGVRRSLLEAVGGIEAVRRDLSVFGLDESDLDELALRICAVNAYADQRLRPRISVSLQEIEAAYRDLTAELAAAGQEPPAMTAVHEQLHRLVAERKLNDEIERWVVRATAEREITRFVR